MLNHGSDADHPLRRLCAVRVRDATRSRTSAPITSSYSAAFISAPLIGGSATGGCRRRTPSPHTLAAPMAAPDVWLRGDHRGSQVRRRLAAGGKPLVPLVEAGGLCRTGGSKSTSVLRRTESSNPSLPSAESGELLKPVE